MLPPTAWGRISPERFKRRSRNFTPLSETIGLTNLPDMTSLEATYLTSGKLHNAIKYCTNVRKTGAVGIEAHNSVPV